MITSLKGHAWREFRGALPALGLALLLPLPLLNFWQDGPGRAFAFAYLFFGCAFLAAERFMPRHHAGERAGPEAQRLWLAKMLALAFASAIAVAGFSASQWAVTGTASPGVPLLASLVAVPAVCAVPYLTMVARDPHAAVLLATATRGVIKLTGCVAVRVVYGPGAQASGEMAMSWDEPNLLVRLCFAGGMAYSVAMLILGYRRFRRG